MDLLCPLCAEPLTRQEKRYCCSAGHSFDIARQGYVNLLPVQQKHSVDPGDTREQVLSRRAFLDTQTYAPILEAVIHQAQKWGAQGEILDVGCGEGYYGAGLSKALGLPLTGVDISKEAVRCAAARYKGPTWLCATAAHLPVKSESVGLLTSLFAVTMEEEFLRVLQKGGLYIQVLAAEDHLLGLKRIIYDELTHKHKDSTPVLPGFTLVESQRVSFSFTLEGEQIPWLFSMTPHVFRIGAAGAKRLAQTQVLQDTASCVVNVYRK